MDAKSRKNIEEIETTSRYPTGIGRIDRGECPRGALSPAACMLCDCGHMLECHFPNTCEEAECDHYKDALKLEMDDERG